MSRTGVCATLLVQASLVLFSQHPLAQTHDSTEGQSEVERGVRLRQELREAQKEMDSVFNEAVQLFIPTEKEKADNAKLPAAERNREGEYGKRMLRDMKVSQEAWLAYRDASCRSVSDFYEDGSGEPNAVASCNLEMTTARTKFLRDFFVIQK